MNEYRIDKTIDELDPIPGEWTETDVNRFVDDGFLAMAGMTPQAGVYKTKKVNLDSLYERISAKNPILVAEGAAAMLQDGNFSVREVRRAGTEITIENGQIKLPAGWFSFDAQFVYDYTGAPLNRYDTVTVTCSFHNLYTSKMIDFSYAHSDTGSLSALVYNQADGANLTFTVNVPDNLSGLSVTMPSVSVNCLRLTV